MDIPDQYRSHWKSHRETIRTRLREFAAVPPDEYFFELLFCLLTPQSRAAHAEIAIAKLREAGLPKSAVDPIPILRDPDHYIRFHNQKGRRISLLLDSWSDVQRVLADPGCTSADCRAWLVEHVNGLGMKEASHFLRNIGHFDLAIIDRHVLKHLFENRVIEKIPPSITPKRYLDLEQKFIGLARSWGLTLQELDLLLWSFEEGSVRK